MTSAKSKSQGNSIVITIDGPAGAGKSTVAKRLADKLKYMYLDTGAMYRALTFKALNNEINLKDEDALINLARSTTLDIAIDEERNLHVLLDNVDVTEQIRSKDVTNSTFYVAKIAGVREVLVEKQREIGEKTNVVVEGRDVGTVVFPNAAKKFYLDADFEERSRRRIKELEEKGITVDDERTKKDLKDRDTKDMTREVGPLKKAEDAILIDSTGLLIEEVVEKMLEYLNVK